MRIAHCVFLLSLILILSSWLALKYSDDFAPPRKPHPPKPKMIAVP